MVRGASEGIASEQSQFCEDEAVQFVIDSMLGLETIGTLIFLKHF
jgi:hypothetical protein